MNRRRAILSGLGLASVALPAHAQISTKLKQQTALAFDSYISNAEAQFEWRGHLSPIAGGPVIFSAGNGSSPVEVPDGLIHDWIAGAIAPNTSVEKVLALFQDYASYKIHYSPNVSDSRAIARDGNKWRVFLRLHKKQVLTVNLNTEYDIQYNALGGGRWSVISRSTKVAEVEDGKELPVGTGSGFLWRLNSYWLLEPRPGGVYMECRAISLSRDSPTGLGWLVKPMITTVPRESLIETVNSTVKALTA